MNKDRKNIVSLVILYTVLVLMLFPAVWRHFSKLEERPLSGDVRFAKNEQFEWHNWFTGEYSETKNKYLNDNFGFHNFFVRLRNEMYYLAFKKPEAQQVVIGKNGFLYESKYPQTYSGLDYVGEKEITRVVTELKFIQDTLEKQGIKFAILFAPGKATYYPEYLPPPYTAAKETNYLKYIEIAKQQHLNFVDFNAMFLKLKPVTKYPLYPKTGTHWSVYGMNIAFDSLLKYMEKNSGEKLPEMVINKVIMSDSLRSPDEDIGDGMNLLCPLSHFTMAYPEIEWQHQNDSSKPRVLTVSDSYWMGIYFLNLPREAFSYHEFWYYNKQLYNYDKSNKIGDPADHDLKESVEQNDFVFIMASEAQLSQLGWGFIDDLYSIYKNGDNEYNKKNRKRNAELLRIEYDIQGNAGNLYTIKKIAKENNISPDSCLRFFADSIYTAKHHQDTITNVTIRSKMVDDLINKIKADKEWFNSVKKDARDKGISLDSSLCAKAEWIIKQEEDHK